MYSNNTTMPGMPGMAYTLPSRPPASDVARIEGHGLTQVIVTNVSPLTYHLFLNDRHIPQEHVESLSLYVEAPEAGNPLGGTVRATLTRLPHTVGEDSSQQRLNLFPGTVQIVACGRRICLTGLTADTLDGLWISLGVRPDGGSSEVCGAKALRILFSNGLLDAKLTWEDGTIEDLLPQS